MANPTWHVARKHRSEMTAADWRDYEWVEHRFGPADDRDPWMVRGVPTGEDVRDHAHEHLLDDGAYTHSHPHRHATPYTGDYAVHEHDHTPAEAATPIPWEGP